MWLCLVVKAFFALTLASKLALWVLLGVISLPLYPKMSPGDVQRVVEAVRRVVERHRR